MSQQSKKECFMDDLRISDEATARKGSWDIQNEVDELINSYAGKLEATIEIVPKIVKREENPTAKEMQIMSMRALKRAEKGTGTSFMKKLCKIADDNDLVITGYLADKGWSGDPGYDIIDKKVYKSTESSKRLMDFYKRFGFKRGAKAVADPVFPFGNIHRMPHAVISANESTDDPFTNETIIMDDTEKTIKVGDKVTMNTPDDLDWHGKTGTVVQMTQDGSVIKLGGTGQKLMVLNSQLTLSEYYVGQSAGYGGGAMAGGGVAPTNWAGTFSSNQTSRRLKDYPASRRYTYMQGNTVIGSSLYDTITQDDLKDDRFDSDEIMAGLRWEMKHMEYPSKDVARPIVIKNLETNPKYYSDLDMYFKSDKQGKIMENIDTTELAMGIDVEKEHTQDEALARKIAMDHLAEDPRYYSKLNAAGLGHGDEQDSEIEQEPGNIDTVVVTLAAPICSDTDSQSKLTTSGLGSGSPKPLKSTNLTAPETKVVNDKNTVVYGKTPTITGLADPLNHFASQIQAGIQEKW
jgi:hypothetical protein